MFNDSNSKYVANFISSSAESYYKYLKSTTKSTEKNIATKVARKDELLFLVKFESEIKNIDFISCFAFDNHIVDASSLKFGIVDEYTLEFEITDLQLDYFLFSKKIYLIVDFTTLVLNIRDKFKQKDCLLYFPDKISPLSFNFSEFKNIPFSHGQKKAISNIFSSPFSYVWGAAGTGKTRFVLSYSILYYLLSRKRVLLLAPTNIALENAMSAIIDLSKEYGIHSSDIKRLGLPSREFYSKYPEYCMHPSSSTAIYELSSKKSDIQQYLNITKTIAIHNTLENSIIMIDKYTSEFNQLNSIAKELSLNVNLIKAQLIKHKKNLYTVNNVINELEKKRNTFFHRFIKMFRQESSFDNEINRNLILLNDIKKSINKKEQHINSLSKELSDNEEKLQIIKANIKKEKQNFSRFLSMLNIPDAIKLDKEYILDHISNYKQKSTITLNYIKKKHPDCNFNDEDMLHQIVKDLELKIKEENTKYQNELKRTRLIGCTLDTFATSSDYEYDHVFLDEACYTCCAKASLVYLCNCPVTFLGDHMQLPPVSEIDEGDLLLSETKDLFIWSENGIYSAYLFEIGTRKMYEKYINNDVTLPKCLNVSFLTETYRFGDMLAKLLDKHVYKGGFHSASDYSTDVLIIDAKKKTPTKLKRQNMDEAKAIKRYLKNVNSEDSYIILTPYKNQVIMLKEQLPKHIKKILTIHKSQGQEWDTVIISVCDTANKFFTDTNNPKSKGRELLNTAISRAKQTLIIVCDVDYWKSVDDQIITDLINIGYISVD